MKISFGRYIATFFMAMQIALFFTIFSAPAQTNTLDIAIVGPMSGDLSPQGRQMEKGAQAAAAKINSRGGVAGNQIRIFTFDDGGTPAGAEAAAREIVKQGIRFVVGHYNSGSSIAAAPFYAKHNTLMVSPGSTNPMLTEFKLWNVARTSSRDDAQGSFAGNYIAKHFPGRRIALVSDGTPYAQGLILKARAALKASGQPAKGLFVVKPQRPRYDDTVAKLRAAKIDLVFFAGLANEYGLLLRGCKEAGLNIQFVSGDGTLVNYLPTIAGSAVEGSLVAFSLNDADNPSAKDAVASLKAVGVNEFEYTLKSYAALETIAGGIDQAKSQTPRLVATAIRSGQPIKTVLGDLSFTSAGDRREPDIMMYVWRDNTIVPAP
ncbi:branched-chain amino acid ABC transporter substrate-binding protein [Mycolicibacterium aubagnense]